MLKHVQVHCIDNGDTASFHDWEFRTRLRIAGKSGDQHIEAVSKVCDGLRGDALVASKEAGLILCVKLLTEDQVVLMH